MEKYPAYFAAFSNNDEVINESSSGGIFFELANKVIENNGVVYGAAWKSIEEVRHIRVEKTIDLKLLQKSKYIRSNLGEIYKRVNEDLSNGLFVLFSGTPCQISGLYVYLKTIPKNLLTVEVVCHGVPIKVAYLKYIHEKEIERGANILSIDFRNKSRGWKNNSIVETFSNGKESVLSTNHPHHRLYLQGINMEKGCGECHFAKVPRLADITLADFWDYKGELLIEGINKGISLVVINNPKGMNLFSSIMPIIKADLVTSKEAEDSCRHLCNPPFLHSNQSAFEDIIKIVSFANAADMCSKFGDVVKVEKLVVLNKHDISQILRTFVHDSSEIIYISEDNSILGIVTFGSFVSNYLEGKDYINYEFKKVSLKDTNCVAQIEEIFNCNTKISRIPVFLGEKMLYEVRRKINNDEEKDTRRYLIPFYRIAVEKRKCFFFKRPDLLDEFNYGETRLARIQKHLSFPVLAENRREDYYRFHLKSVLGEKYSDAYIEYLCQIPPIVKKGNRFLHKDCNTRLINVIGGYRNTCNQPDHYKFTVHIYGRCGVFGYAVEDRDTLPSKLQMLLNERQIRVVSHSTWGAKDECIIQNINEDLIDGIIGEQDIIIFYMNYLFDIELLHRLGIYTCDTTRDFHHMLEKGLVDFYDIPGHMNANGYEIIAERIIKEIDADIEIQLCRVEQVKKTKQASKGELLSADQKDELNRFLNYVKSQIKEECLSNLKIGAIVMNCNPFTKGHRFLVEEAAKRVDKLIIFVVQEDNSEFSFEHRFKMVEIGTADLKNVYIFPSGFYIISSFTLPDYVFKKQSKSVMLDMSLDVEIFARYIAPQLNIRYRFVGSEQEDYVTAEYNRTLKRVLSQYEICLIEVERLKVNSQIISASIVRDKIRSKDLHDLSDLLPDSTVTFLCNNGYI